MDESFIYWLYFLLLCVEMTVLYLVDRHRVAGTYFTSVRQAYGIAVEIHIPGPIREGTCFNVYR